MESNLKDRFNFILIPLYILIFCFFVVIITLLQEGELNKERLDIIRDSFSYIKGKKYYEEAANQVGSFSLSEDPVLTEIDKLITELFGANARENNGKIIFSIEENKFFDKENLTFQAQKLLYNMIDILNKTDFAHKVTIYIPGVNLDEDKSIEHMWSTRGNKLYQIMSADKYKTFQIIFTDKRPFDNIKIEIK